jgi:predicted dehydrogenase
MSGDAYAQNHGGQRSGGDTAIAVVGFGNAGQQHVAAIDAVPGARLAAVVETDPRAAGKAAALGLPVRPLTAVLDDPSVSLVALCLPPGYRPPIASAVLAAGKHLLVEKLPARSAAELGETLLAAARAGRVAGVMFQQRFVLPEPLRAGAPERFAGAVGTLLVSRPRFDSHYREGWRAQPRIAGGGVTAHLGVHYLDLACQLLGEPAAVIPLARTDAAEGIDAQLCGHVSYRCGAELAVTVTSRAAARHEQLTVLGERDRVEIRDGAASGELDGHPVTSAARPASELRIAVYTELVAAVRGGPPPDLAALSRSRGVMTVLDGLLTAPADLVAG